MIDISSTSARYNWWTPTKKKEEISVLTQLSSIMQHGNTREVFEICQQEDIELLQAAYTQVSRDNWGTRKKRQSYIESLLHVRKSGSL